MERHVVQIRHDLHEQMKRGGRGWNLVWNEKEYQLVDVKTLINENGGKSEIRNIKEKHQKDGM